MLKKFVTILGGDPNKRTVDKLSQVVERINALEAEYEDLSDEALRSKTDSFRTRLQQGESLDDILPETFATVREASKRTIGLRHYEGIRRSGSDPSARRRSRFRRDWWGEFQGNSLQFIQEFARLPFLPLFTPTHQIEAPTYHFAEEFPTINVWELRE